MAILFDPWKPLFGGYMPLSLLVSYRRDRGGLLATVLLEMYAADRLSLAALRRARLTLPAQMPEAYDSLPAVLDDLIEAADVAGKALTATGVGRPQTADEAVAVRDLVIEIVETLVGGPVQVRWQFPRHLRPANEQTEDNLSDLIHDEPPVRQDLVVAADDGDVLLSSDGEYSDDDDDDSEDGDGYSLRRTASVSVSARLSQAFPLEDLATAAQTAAPKAAPPTRPPRPVRSPQLKNPFGSEPLPPIQNASPDDSDEGEETTVVINPGDLAARIGQAGDGAQGTADGATVPLKAITGFEVGTPAEAEISLEPEASESGPDTLDMPPAEPVPTAVARDVSTDVSPLDGGRSVSPHLIEALMSSLEAGLFLEPQAERPGAELRSWNIMGVGAVEAFSDSVAVGRPEHAEAPKVSSSVLVRAAESLLAIHAKTVDALEARIQELTTELEARQERIDGLEGTLACVVTQVERLGDGRELDEGGMGLSLRDHPSVVAALRRAGERLPREAASAATASVADEDPEANDLRWQLADREREARSLRILSAWGQLRALIAELREEVAEAVEPRELFDRPSLSDAERGRLLLHKWDDIQRYASVLHDKLPEEALQAQFKQMQELATFMEALAGQGGGADSALSP